ncbi:MAG: 16S rRNA (guanine(527)-N(7))-methyltransferase RsmG [Acidobacteriaceae bacterium]
MTAALPADRISTLLAPYLRDAAPPADLYDRLSVYLDLLLKWNARTNLTAIRSPEEIVRRHFGESLFAGLQLESRWKARLDAGLGAQVEASPQLQSTAPPRVQPEAAAGGNVSGSLGDWVKAPKTVLDFGSGAGFPGLPMQLLHPEWSVTLAESQGKKASFLREVVRALELETEVWSDRVQAMAPVAGLVRQFDAVTLRAVDKMEKALEEARRRVRPGGWMLSFATQVSEVGEQVRLPGDAPGWLLFEPMWHQTGQ